MRSSEKAIMAGLLTKLARAQNVRADYRVETHSRANLLTYPALGPRTVVGAPACAEADEGKAP